MNKTKQRLVQLKTSLDQQDYEMAQLQMTLLSEDPEMFELVEAFENQDYQSALTLIEDFLNSLSPSTNAGMVEFQDTDLEELRAQLKSLEEMVESLSEQKAEQLALIHEFTTKQSLATGEVVQQILQLRKDIEREKIRQKKVALDAVKSALKEQEQNLAKLKAKREELEDKLAQPDEDESFYEEIEDELDELNEAIKEQQKIVKEERKKVNEDQNDFEETAEEDYEEAQQEYEQFEESFQEAKEDKVSQLNDKDKGLLKKLFRKAVKLCHPDTVSDEFKKQAHEIMQQLNNARDNGDVSAVKELLDNLNTGQVFVAASDQLTDRHLIEAKIEELVVKVEAISTEIEQINEDETWQLIVSLESWEAYFEQSINELNEYLERLKSEYQSLLESEVLETQTSQTLDKSSDHSPKEHYSETRSKTKQHSDTYWDEEF